MENVNVKFSVALSGYYSGEVTMSRKEFEEMEVADHNPLNAKLAEFVDWSDITVQVESCEQLEIVGQPS